MRMHHDGSASNSKTQILQTNIQIRCPFMQDHIWCPIWQFVIRVEHIANVGILGIGVPILETCLTQFDCNNKIKYKNYWNWDNLIKLIHPFKHQQSTTNAQHYFQVTNQLQIMRNLCDSANILMLLQN